MWNFLNFSFSMSQAQKVGSSPKLESDRGQVCTCMKRLTGSLRTGNMFYLRLTIFDDDEIAQIFSLLKKCPRWHHAHASHDKNEWPISPAHFATHAAVMDSHYWRFLALKNARKVNLNH